MKTLKLYYVNFILFTFVATGVFGFGVFLFNDGDPLETLAATDTDPPVITDIKVGKIQATTTTITWTTDEESDSLVNYGLDRRYGISRDPHFDKINHEIILEELQPNTTYYFRVTSTDGQGNQRISNDFSFKTPLADDYQAGNLDDDIYEVCDKLLGEGEGGQKDEKPEVPAEEERYPEGELIEEILEKIDQIQEERSLEIINEHIENVAEDISSELTIILDTADIEIGSDYAIIYWSTNKEANSVVSLATEEQYDEYSDSPYRWNEGFPDESVEEHVVEITGLTPATTYHFQVKSETAIGQEAKSEDRIFTTKSILPQIYNLAVSKVQEDSATLTWTTNIPTSAIAEYANLNTGESKLEGHSNFVTAHSLQLKNLIFDTYYSVIVTVENEQNEKAQSQPVTFITTRDQVPPAISKVSSESTLYPGSDNKVQSIISWESDEPGKCQLNYHQGIIAIDEAESLPEEVDFTTKHVQVVTNFLPSTVYKFWVTCKDDADNSARSDDYTMLTPSQEESIIDIILKNFESTFGWLKKIKV